MLEICINIPEDEIKGATIKDDIERLCKNGWAKFGNNGSVVLFKDISLDEGRYELEYLGINHLKAEEWKEN